jgi:hypothetical protein
MSQDTLKSTIRAIVTSANQLRLRHAPTYEARISYSAIFCQNNAQFDSLKVELDAIGRVADETPTGPVYIVPEMPTAGGLLKIVKLRAPDPTRPEQGDADFALENYPEFKAANLGRPGFRLIEREHFEMIELIDRDFAVRAYFSHPPVEEQPAIKKSLAADRK